MRIAAICCKDRVVSVLEGGYGRLARFARRSAKFAKKRKRQQQQTSKDGSGAGPTDSDGKATVKQEHASSPSSASQSSTTTPGATNEAQPVSTDNSSSAKVHRDLLDRSSLARVCAAHVSALTGSTRKWKPFSDRKYVCAKPGLAQGVSCLSYLFQKFHCFA